ncbi:MAG TPA: tetratricopeptide repeat protein [Candidatus Xenobia bacterium]|nr:tetratricopeptide repeat protein [Candidatus Xenobia bacterium]
MKSLPKFFCIFLVLLAPMAALPQTAASDPTDAAEARAQAYYHYTLGRLYLELAGDFNRGDQLRRAIEEFKETLKYDPNANDAVVQLAEAYRRSGRIREAVIEARQLVEKDPDNLAAHRLLGRVYFQTLGETDGAPADPGAAPKDTLALAIQEYEQVARLAPDDTDALLDLARLYRLANDLAKAEATLKQLLEREPSSEVGLSALASIYSDKGDYQKAVELLTSATAESATPRLLASLAYAYEQAGNHDNAIDAYRRAVQLDPKNFELRRRLAEALLEGERLEEALTEFQELAKADPDDGDVAMRIAQVYRHQKKYPEAQQWIARAKRADPDNLEIGFQEALLHESQGQFEQAITVLSDMVARMTRASGQYSPEEKRGRSIVLERLGVLYRDNEKFPEAVQTFELLLGLDENAARRGYAQITETHRQARNYQAARAALDQALARFPDDRAFLMQKAMLDAELGQLEPAVQAVQEQLKETPDDRSLYITLAQVYERNKRYADAEAALAKAEELSKGPQELEDVYFLSGAVCERQKKLDLAEQKFRKVLEINPDSAITLNYLGYMFADANIKLPEAVDLLKRAVELEPYNGAYLDSLGWAYYRLEKYDLAEDYLLRAVSRISRDATIHDHLGDLYFKTGRLHEAAAQWERALAAWQMTSPTEHDSEAVAKLEDKLHSVKLRLARESGKGAPKKDPQ